MSAAEEQPQTKQRTKKVPPLTEDQEPHTFLVRSSGKPAPRSAPPDLPDEENFSTEDPLRQRTSVVRLAAPNTTTQRTTGAAPQPRPIPPRRQIQDGPPQRVRAGLQPSPREQREQNRHKTHPLKRVHWLLYVGAGMVLMLILFVTGQVALGWISRGLDDLHYGTPRTYHVDKFVGDGDSAQHPSHFVAINLNRQAIVIQFVGGDPTKSSIYVAPFLIGGDGGDLAPVTVDFRNVTGHTNNELDMVVTIHLAQSQVFVFVNTGTGFRPSNANDKLHL